MQPTQRILITVEALVNAPIEKVWKCWALPMHIIRWNHSSDDWHTTRAENDLRIGGKFLSRMEAKDGSFGFDFEGVYENVIPLKHIVYGMADGRKVSVMFEELKNKTTVTEVFDAEGENSPELQRQGWQSILNNFKNYCEETQKL